MCERGLQCACAAVRCVEMGSVKGDRWVCVGRGRTGGERIHMVRPSGSRAPVERSGPGPVAACLGSQVRNPARRQLSCCEHHATKPLWLVESMTPRPPAGLLKETPDRNEVLFNLERRESY